MLVVVDAIVYSEYICVLASSYIVQFTEVVMASGARNIIRKIIQVADAPKALGPYRYA